MNDSVFEYSKKRMPVHVVNDIPNEDLLKIVNWIGEFLEMTGDEKNQFIEHSKVNGFSFIGRGTTSNVYKYKKYAVKISCTGEDIIDSRFLKELNHLSFIPTLYGYSHKFIIFEFKEGKPLSSFEKKNDWPHNWYEILLKQSLQILEQGIFPDDLTLENILYNKETEEFSFIDVGHFEFMNCLEEHREFMASESLDYISIKHMV